MRKVIIFTGFLIFLSLNLWCQQQGIMSQYRQQMSLFNPAAVSIDSTTNLSLLHRRQWTNIPMSPISTSLTYGFDAGRNTGLGISIITDKAFIEQSTFVSLDYSYKLKLNKISNLYLGLKAGGNFYSINTFNLETFSPNLIDPSLNSMSRFIPNIGIGAYYKRKSLFISIGVPRLLSTKIARESNGAVSMVRDQPHLYTSVGYDFSMNIFENIRIKPSILSRYVAGVPISIDFNTMLRYKNRFELGATYRPEGNYAGIILFDVSNALKLGWTYEVNTLPELSAIGASLEFSLLYKY